MSQSDLILRHLHPLQSSACILTFLAHSVPLECTLCPSDPCWFLHYFRITEHKRNKFLKVFLNDCNAGFDTFKFFRLLLRFECLAYELSDEVFRLVF